MKGVEHIKLGGDHDKWSGWKTLRKYIRIIFAYIRADVKF